MLFIGITGEAGAGKSRVMDYLSKKERVFVLYSDDFARELSMPGEECYEAIKKAFPDSSLYEAHKPKPMPPPLPVSMKSSIGRV